MFGNDRRGRGRRRGARVALLASVIACFAVVGAATAAIFGANPFSDSQVGPPYAKGVLLPTNQWVSPLGSRIFQDNARIITSSISPDGRYLAMLTWKDYDTTLTIEDLKNINASETYPIDNGYSISASNTVNPSAVSDKYANEDTTVSPDGPLWSADGKTIWVPQTDYLDKYTFDPVTGTAKTTAPTTPTVTNGAVTTPYSPGSTIWLCGGATGNPEPDPTNPAADCDSYGPGDANGSDIPSGMALSPDGNTLYVALNGSNQLGVINAQTDKVENYIPVGVAPRQVVLADNGTIAYVSNEGGRPTTSSDSCTNITDGTPIVSDCSTGAGTDGTVSVVDLTTGKEIQEIPVGLQPTAMYQDGSTLFVANSNDDSFSVIDENTNTVAQTVSTNPVPGATVGSYANSISMLDPNHILVSIGRDNAIGVYSYSGPHAPIHYDGLLPTDWYPVNAQADPALGPGTVVVTNDKGDGARGPASTINEGADTSAATGHNTYDDTGSVTEFKLTDPNDLSKYTQTVFTDNAWDQIKPVNEGDHDTVPSVIPKKLGEPSPIKHIIVIVKENRSYDQILGDLGEGDGDAALAQFGQPVTPNQHSLALRYGDLDNFYDEGTLSADGHNWIVQAEANDYVEKEFGAFYRSYPSQGGDALAYQRDGFLWNAAQAAGVSVRNYGEYIYNPYQLPANTPSWTAFYNESKWLENGKVGPEPIPGGGCQYTKDQSDIPSLQNISDLCFPNFQLGIPDQYRVDQWQSEFQSDEASGNMPGLEFVWLMTDHTGTTGVNSGNSVPSPVAQVADNDLAVGRLVDQVSHSKFWKSTAIFVDEDDTQNGVDSVDGHRAPTLVISPYSKPGVDNQYYTQLNMVKTIEQILGIKPMNQEDEVAEPMYDAFTASPNFSPYNADPNEIPLDCGVSGNPACPALPAANNPTPHIDTSQPASVPSGMQGIVDAWKQWEDQQAKAGKFNGPDKVNSAQMNRFDWYSAHDWKVAYPGDPKIYLPNQVPGGKLPASSIGGD